MIKQENIEQAKGIIGKEVDALRRVLDNRADNLNMDRVEYFTLALHALDTSIMIHDDKGNIDQSPFFAELKDRAPSLFEVSRNVLRRMHNAATKASML